VTEDIIVETSNDERCKLKDDLVCEGCDKWIPHDYIAFAITPGFNCHGDFMEQSNKETKIYCRDCNPMENK